MKYLSIAFLMLFAAGCTNHHQQVQGGNPAFFLKKTGARQVFLVTDIDDFKPRKAVLIDGQWVTAVSANRAFRYYYLVDGKIFVPPCIMKEKDDFGSENCIFDPGE